LCSSPFRYMCTIKLLKTVVKHIDKYRRHCLWRGTDINAKKPLQAAWNLVCKPKKQGGLGVIHIEKQNKVLLMKNLHKLLNRLDISWVNIMWNNYYNNDTIPTERPVGSFLVESHPKKPPHLQRASTSEGGDGRTTLL
jgi:hypothetical protein